MRTITTKQEKDEIDIICNIFAWQQSKINIITELTERTWIFWDTLRAREHGLNHFRYVDMMSLGVWLWNTVRDVTDFVDLTFFLFCRNLKLFIFFRSHYFSSLFLEV